MKKSKSLRKSEKGVLAVVTLSHLAQHLYAGLSIIYPDMMADLGLNYTQLGVMTGAASITSGFLQMIWSLLPRYFSRRLLLGIGNVLMSFGCFVMGAANRFIDVVSGNLVSGGGQAAQHPVGTSIITRNFHQEKVPRALSIHYGLGYVGNLISPVLLSSIAISLGWRTATHVLAIVLLLTGLTVLYYLRGALSSSESTAEKANILEDIKSAIHVKGAALIIAVQAFAVGGTGMGVIITYTPLFLKNSLGLGSLETAAIYSIAVSGGVIGTIIFGHISERFGDLKTVTSILGACSSLILFLAFQRSYNALLIPHLFIIGATSFASSSILQSHLSSISTPRQKDILIGLFFTFGFGVSSIWSALTGFLIDTYGSFEPAWFLRATLGAVAFSLTMLASRRSQPNSS